MTQKLTNKPAFLLRALNSVNLYCLANQSLTLGSDWQKGSFAQQGRSSLITYLLSSTDE